MAITAGTEKILEAAQLWKERSLIGEQSVFTEEPIWTGPRLEELNRYFVENIQGGESHSFTARLREQIDSVSPPAKRLAAELLWVMALFPTNVGQERKAELVQEVWSWGGSKLPDNHPLLDAPLKGGIGGVGQAFARLRWAELVFFITFLRRFKSESQNRRETLLRDPWSFANYLDAVPGADTRQLRHMLLHLLFPDAFERVASRTDREAIDSHFQSVLPETLRTRLAGDSANVSLDRRLWEIRNTLSNGQSEQFDFYNDDIRVKWKPDGEPLSPPTSQGVKANLERILAEYLNSRANERFGTGARVMGAFRAIEGRLASLAPISERSSLHVDWSAGKGNWSDIPWIALLDSRETTTTRRGVYCVFLFRHDMSGVYLTYNQGVTEPLRELGRERARQSLKDNAAVLRGESPELVDAGFHLDDRIDLRVSGGLGREYQHSTVAYKFYKVGEVPADTQIEEDISAVLAAYDKYLARTQTREPPKTQRYWIFQANPDLFDVRAAIRDLPEMTWLIRQHNEEISRGDRVYLWESGDEGGIGATATILSDPSLEQPGPREAQYVRALERFEEKQRRVRLHIDKRLDPLLKRSDLKEVPGLRELTILRAPVGTNFPVTAAQAGILDRLLDDLQHPPIAPPSKDLRAIHESFANNLSASNISFGARHHAITRAFVASLATKPFVILTGLSGSGKTQIALRFGEWCGKENLLIVPVRPDWTGAEALFGYEDALIEPIEGVRVWHVPDALAFMLRAAGDPTRPYILVLDEMNLAHVERYFADVLSGMESGAPTLPNLVNEDGYWQPADNSEPRIRVPDNLFVIGTVNVDETTYMFSPKVLDRANTIEFRVSTDEMNPKGRKPIECAPGSDDLVRGFLAIARDDRFQLDHPGTGQEPFIAGLKTLHVLLSEGGFEFGHRVFYEAIRFSAVYHAAGGETWQDALDVQVLQKILPRLHGSRRRLEPTLNALARFCADLMSAEDSAAAVSVPADVLEFSESTAALPRSLNKVKRMTRNLRANQFASFAE